MGHKESRLERVGFSWCHTVVATRQDTGSEGRGSHVVPRQDDGIPGYQGIVWEVRYPSAGILISGTVPVHREVRLQFILHMLQRDVAVGRRRSNI